MRDVLKSFFFAMHWMLAVGRHLVSNARDMKFLETSAGPPYSYRDTASLIACSQCSWSKRFRLSVSIPGRVLCLFIFGFFLINVFSCSNKNDLPKGVLSKDEMVNILTEFYVKEARINALHLDQDSAKKIMEYYRYQYSGQTGMPDSIIDISYQYYLSRPREMGEIYDRVIDTLALREQRTNVNTGVKPVE